MSVEFDNMTKKLNDIRMMDHSEGIYDIRPYVFPCGESGHIKPLLIVTYRTKTAISIDGYKEAIFFIEEDTGAPMVMYKTYLPVYVDHDTFNDLNRIFNKFKDVWDEYLARKDQKDPEHEWRIRLFNDEDLTDDDDDEDDEDDDDDDDEDEDEDEDLTDEDDDEEETEQTKAYVVSSDDKEGNYTIWGVFSTEEKAIEFKKKLEYLVFESSDEKVRTFGFVIDETGLETIEAQKKQKIIESLINDGL